jgi:hypothetical protein
MKKSIFGIIFVIVTYVASFAQVTLSPTTLFFENNFSSIVVINNSAAAQDIQVDFVFGYPVSDENGTVSMFYDEGSELVRFDIGPYVRAFPRALTLEAGQRQVVRLSVRPPNNLTDGGYWTRIRVTSTPRSVEAVTVASDAVGAQLNFIFEQILAVYYKKGNPSTGLTVTDNKIVARENGRLLVFNVDMTANAPFLGTIDMTLTNNAGQRVHDGRSVTSIFTDGYRNFPIPDDLTPGTYNLQVVFTASRPDVPSQFNFPMNPYTYNARITIP